MEVKCPKCRLRYDADIPERASAATCVCPRCGTPFLCHIDKTPDDNDVVAVPDGADSETKKSDSTPQVGSDLVAEVRKRAEWGDAFVLKQKKERQRREEQNRRRRRRIVLILSVVTAVFALFFVANIIGGTNEYDDEEARNSAEELFDSIASDAALPPVQPAPEWIKGTWKARSRFYDISLDIADDAITERAGSRAISGTYEYRGTAIVALYSDSVRFVYKVDNTRRRIDCGEGFVMSKAR